MSELKCTGCGYQLRAEWKLCPSCGAKAVHSCGHCGAAAEQGWRLCPFCGHELRQPSKPGAKPARKAPAPVEISLPAPASGDLKPTRGNAVTTWRLANAIAARLAKKQTVDVQSVFRAFDGFRTYVLNPGHYRAGSTDRLVIPHFGTFTLRKHAEKRGIFALTGRKYRVPAGYRLGFRLSPQAQASHYNRHSSRWTREPSPSSKTNQLSVQRRIAIFVSEEEGLGLEAVDLILTEMYRQILHLLLSKRHEVAFYKLGRFSARRFKPSDHASASLSAHRKGAKE